MDGMGTTAGKIREAAWTGDGAQLNVVVDEIHQIIVRLCVQHDENKSSDKITKQEHERARTWNSAMQKT